MVFSVVYENFSQKINHNICINFALICMTMIDELIVCLTIESQRCGSRRFDRYTAGLHQAMVSTDCVTV